MENREALENAGFGEYGQDQVVLIREPNVIYVNYKNLDVEVYLRHEREPIIKQTANGLKQVNKILFGVLGYDILDFTEKPKYDWETVKKELENHKSIFEDCFNSIDKISAYGWISKQEALSMIAKLKLNIIIQQIDKDYPPVPTETVMGGIRYQDSELQVHYFQDGYSSKNSKVVTATIEGAQILLDQNTQLLKNLFKIETDATTD